MRFSKLPSNNKSQQELRMETFTDQEAIHLVAEHAGVAILTNASVSEFQQDGVVIKALSDPSLCFNTCLVMRSDDDAKLTNGFARISPKIPCRRFA